MTIKRNGIPTRYVFLHNGERLKKAYHNGTKEIWSAGSMVTYVVDTDKTYTEEVDYGATCLAPTTFTPEKSGWEFIGWREDTTASSDVLTGKVMGSDAITLYAVYTQGADISFVFDNKTHSMTSFRYCNASGDTRNATISVPYGEDYSGWTWRGWSNANVTTADGEVFTNGGGAITDITSDSTYYGLYTQTIECSFVSRNSTQKVTGTKYHSASGDTVNATITTPVGADYSGYTWRGWSAEGDTVADADVAFVNNDTISDLSSGGTYYGLYQKNIILTVVIDSARMNYNGKLYYNASGSSKLPTFTVADPSKDGYIFVGWGTTEDSTTAVYDNITDLAIASNRTVYAVFTDAVAIFSYTGTIQEFVVPATGNYRLDAYGAQGGGVRTTPECGGAAGYSYGYKLLTKGQKLYIVVGGQGTTALAEANSTLGGYNGGGDGSSYKKSSGTWPIGGSGGGATHIATVTGLLSTLSDNMDSVLLVAGGGGGAGGLHGWNDEGDEVRTRNTGGTGGGLTGGTGLGGSSTGGTQTSGGTSYINGSFGTGGSSTSTYPGAGGGGGFYGGAAGYFASGAGGGSGYIGGVSDGETTNGTNEGPGRAAITYVA